MISPTARDAFTMLVELYEMSPDVRIGQLLAHLGILGEDQAGRSLWDIDDEEFLAVLYRHREELAARRPDGDRTPAFPMAIVTGNPGSGNANIIAPVQR
jgi:hypothetical protein